MQIPKVIHIVWVGDEKRRPDNCIATWRQQNPTWTVRVWGNDDYRRTPWVNRAHMTAMWTRELNGVADLMRWEILLAHGGFAIDADSVCIRPLDDALFTGGDVFAAYANEKARPGRLATGYVAATPKNRLIRAIVSKLTGTPSVTRAAAFISVGPVMFTNVVRETKYPRIRIWPSHYFMPEFHRGPKYTGSGPVYGRQLWASTRKSYDRLHRMPVVDLVKGAFSQPPPPPSGIRGRSAQKGIAMKRFVGDLSEADALLLERYSRTAQAVLEFGAGGSTQIIAQSLASRATFTTIETEAGWISATRDRLARLGVSSRCRFLSYERRSESTGALDLIFVDGRWPLRRAFATEAWSRLVPNGRMLFHDTRRLRDVENVLALTRAFYTEVANIQFNEDSSNITVLTKRARPLPYENWRTVEKKPAWKYGAGEVPERFWATGA